MRRMGHPAAEPRRDTPIPASAQVSSRTRTSRLRVRLETCALAENFAENFAENGGAGSPRAASA